MRETYQLEYKEKITNTFLKSVSAFANFNGGIIKLGIKDNGQVCGIEDIGKACLDIENKINDSIKPKPDFKINVDYASNIIILFVTEGMYKPYFYKGKAYRRSDTSTVEVDQLELKRLILEGNNLNYEDLKCDNQQLSFSLLESKLKKELNVSELSRDTLKTLGLLTKDGYYTIAASLFADINNNSGIDTVRFGKSINELLNRKTSTKISILQQYEEAVEMYKLYYQYEKIDGFTRKKKDLIPENAFREAIANALIHRTWDICSHIRVSMYDNYVEIVSPGGLPSGISEAEYLKGDVAVLRNPVIANIFYRLNYIENLGTGIRRIKEAYRNYTIKPTFSVFENSIRVVLPVISEVYSTTTDGKKVMEVMSDYSILSSKEIATRLGWSKDKTIRNLNKLVDSQYIEVVGTGRGTKYTKR
jgi:ATP-dependent DNA helicase RecG